MYLMWMFRFYALKTLQLAYCNAAAAIYLIFFIQTSTNVFFNVILLVLVAFWHLWPNLTADSAPYWTGSAHMEMQLLGKLQYSYIFKWIQQGRITLNSSTYMGHLRGRLCLVLIFCHLCELAFPKVHLKGDWRNTFAWFTTENIRAAHIHLCLALVLLGSTICVSVVNGVWYRNPLPA